MPEFVVDGVRLHYETRGRGRPVLLLHGFSSSYRGTWENTSWVELLAERGLRTVGLDFRGHGASAKPHEPDAYVGDRLAADVLALLDEVDLPRADVLGYSMGGGVALRLAMSQPGRVRSVVVGGVGDAALDRLADHAEIAVIADALEAASETEVTSPSARRIRQNAVAGGNDLRALAACMRSGRGWPGGLPDLRPFAAPVLLVVAEDDQFMRRHGELVALIRPEVVRLRGRDHHSAIHAPEFREAVLEFLLRRR